MYFVVYIVSSRKYTVVPENWIREITLHTEKFFNNGLNRSQKYYCYWCNNSAARDENGHLKLDFAPNFGASLSAQFPSEGWYACMIRKAKAEYEDAKMFSNKLRTPPAIYNPLRLRERPIPSPIPCIPNPKISKPIPSETEDLTTNSQNTSNNEIFSTTTHSQTPSNDSLPSCSHWNDPNINNNPENNANNKHSNGPDNEQDKFEDKSNELVPVHDYALNNANEIELVLDEPQEEICNDMVMTYTKFPQPMKMSTKGLLKRENDIISGNIAFNESKNGRVYEIDENYCVIPNTVVEVFKVWNSNNLDKSSIAIDERFTRALLLVLVPREKLTASNININVIDFIQKLLAIRSDYNKERISAVPRYIQQFCDAMMSKRTFQEPAQ